MQPFCNFVRLSGRRVYKKVASKINVFEKNNLQIIKIKI